MGRWEDDSKRRCVDCGAILKEPKVDKRGNVKSVPYYKVQGRGPLCPACWTTTRLHPSLRSA